MPEGQVNQTGDQGDQDFNNSDSLGWRAALPDEFKEHEYVKTFQKPGDFVKASLGIKTDYDALKSKMDRAIFKPGDKATPEEISAYRKSMGVPEKPEEYEFPEGENLKNEPEMIDWFRGVALKSGLSKEQAKGISLEWNAFVQGMVAEEERLSQEAKKEAEQNFRKQFKTEDEYKSGRELAKRFWNRITNTDFDKVYEEAEAWQTPLFMSFIFNVAKAVGEDFTPQGSHGRPVDPNSQEALIKAMYGR